MKYMIADVVVDFEVEHPRLKRQIEDYIYNGDRQPNISIRLTEEFYEIEEKNHPHLNRESLEYIFLGSEYYNALVHFDGMMLHSSCVVYNGKAYLFSAPSGTGKSTHTQLWLKRFPGAYILNDDKPALRILPDGVYAYGTPFSGKTDLNINKRVPVGGICIIERGEENKIEKMDTDFALFNILNQTVRPVNEEEMDKMLVTLDKIIRTVPLYKLSCNMDIEAAEVSYNGMK